MSSDRSNFSVRSGVVLVFVFHQNPCRCTLYWREGIFSTQGEWKKLGRGRTDKIEAWKMSNKEEAFYFTLTLADMHGLSIRNVGESDIMISYVFSGKNDKKVLKGIKFLESLKGQKL